MTVISSATSTAAESASTTSQNGLMANYELFLSILTTQIQNQDPLDPMDSAEYTNQLVQYSNVEQSIQQNKNLESIIASLESNQSMSYVSYIGNEITADASSTLLSGSAASWGYELQEDASGSFEIRNSSGDLVYSGEVELKAGSGTFNWAGQTDAGTDAADGVYSISFDLRDANSRPEKVTTAVSGIVDSVDWSSGSAVLSVDGRSVPVSSVLSVSRPS
ncbi:flagellar hook capping FlgD N-terminal domain-containing protein [Roseibium porphyridii]|uniref:Basal-body rod modification protein FlgD n=1 Tax=Roseibium porphyridii TaxID=2866279 RepID=A0ABY8F9X9_9HYPH|nr:MULTISPECIES: flagellar hook capping FlgD N-terminal domain-containing protein [Stappiaceae]QFT30714.1 Basal-body rod modification protein FlgD [Labrenzia sp. THAF82]WFE91344.1 flagellar hook capping FlgD N-terminal domain-containing protein [Roseibium sp. KMA01]